MSNFLTNRHTILTLYMNEVNHYKLLTPQEEQEIGKKLSLKDKINIFENNNYSSQIDIKKVLCSIKSLEEKDYILDKLYNSYFNYCNEYTKNNIKALIDQYNNLTTVLKRIPTKEEIENTLKISCSNIEPIKENLSTQVDLLCIYSEAKDKLIKSNLKLVVSIANKYANFLKKLDLLDLINIGNISLLKAADKFNIEKGIKFSTFAICCIKRDMSIEIYKQDPTIKLPINLQRLKYKCDNVKDEYFIENGKEIDIEELSKIMKIPKKKVLKIEELPNCISYNQIVNYESPDNEFILNTITNKNENFMDDIVIKKEMKSTLQKVFKNILSPKEIYIMEHYYGLNNNTPQVLTEIGKQFNVTNDAIRQNKVKSIKKIKQYDKRNNNILKNYLN